MAVEGTNCLRGAPMVAALVGKTQGVAQRPPHNWEQVRWRMEVVKLGRGGCRGVVGASMRRSPMDVGALS